MQDTIDEEGTNVEENSAEGGSAAKSKDLLKVYVGGLPFSCTKTEVREHFTKCGDIDWLHMPLDKKERHRGIAFISFWKQESVDAALELNETQFGEHVIKVNMAGDKPAKDAQKEKKTKDVDKALRKNKAKAKEKANTKSEQSLGASKDRKVFIGNVPFKCSAETLKKDFSECGAIQQLRMPVGEDGKSKGIAFVTFATKEGVNEALKFHETDYGGSTLTVRMASEKVEKGKLKGIPRAEVAVRKSEDAEVNPLEVIVKGLAFGTKEDVLRDAFVDCGIIDTLRIPLNKKGKSYGFAFVAFQEKKAMKKAIKLSGSEINGRPCTIEKVGEAQSKQSATEDSQKRPASLEEDTAQQELPKSSKKRPKVTD